MRQRYIITSILLFTALIFTGTAFAKTTFVSIGTGGTGGIYYPYGGGVAELWSKNVKGVKAVAEVTGASVENVKLAHKGETVIGEVMGDVAVAGYNGLSKFKGKKHNILSMAIMYPNLLQVVSLKKSGINDIEQVKGNNISTGSPGSGTNFMAEAVLNALEIPLDSFKDSRLSFTESANALRDGTIKVGVWSVGPGTSSILDLSTTHDINI
ncbi:MAG: TAXI family TRAP transporter solute-binding subunit, partial [Desulfobacula sp.]|nr:TAXI family TRAP transporter solute-binding subunit [Desulfobacula sp.]